MHDIVHVKTTLTAAYYTTYTWQCSRDSWEYRIVLCNLYNVIVHVTGHDSLWFH